MESPKKDRFGHTRCAILLAGLLLTLCSCTIPFPNKALDPEKRALHPEGSKKQAKLVPLPALSNSPSRGSTIGFLPVLVIPNSKNEISAIVAPSVTYNSLTELNLTFRLFRYFDSKAKYRIIGGYSSRINRRLLTSFEMPEFYSPNLFASGEFNAFRDGTVRFFGIGPNSLASTETNFTHEEVEGRMRLGYRITDVLNVAVESRVSYDNAAPGADDDEPFLSTIFPVVEGVPDHRTLSNTVEVFYDSRPNGIMSYRGLYVSGRFEVAENIGPFDSEYARLTLETRGLYPLVNDRFVTVARFKTEHMTGPVIPFLELSMLGGETSFRAYPEYRFLDRGLILLSLEERIRITKSVVSGTSLYTEVAPFFEFGTVAPGLGNLTVSDLRPVGGVGFRLRTENVTAKVDVGISKEETAVFAGLDYPF